MVAMQLDTGALPLSESERRAMSYWLKRGRHGKRGDKAPHAQSRARALLQAPRSMQGPQSQQGPQPPAQGPPVDPAQLVYSGPVNALSIAYRVASIPQPVGFRHGLWAGSDCCVWTSGLCKPLWLHRTV